MIKRVRVFLQTGKRTCRPNHPQAHVFKPSLFELSRDPTHFSGYQEQDMDFALG